MRFIKLYFNIKLEVIERLLETTKDAWDNRVWLAVIGLVLWTMFCIIGGMILLPIDIIYSAVMWHKHDDFREMMEEIEEELVFDCE